MGLHPSADSRNLTARQLSEVFLKGTKIAIQRMLERKALLGQSVVIVDAEGKPITVLASEVLRQQRENIQP